MMDGQDNRLLLERYLAGLLDTEQEYALRHEGVVIDMPQSGERIRGRDHMKAMQELEVHLRGELIYPNDQGYEAARKVWNGMIDKYPAAIVRCADGVDVVHAVQFARDHHLLVAVCSGGHSMSGSSVCDRGMVIDLSGMKGIRVDAKQKTAWAQAGLRLGEFVQATQAYGLATTTGTVGGTGLAGLTLGGGLGWFMGK